MNVVTYQYEISPKSKNISIIVPIYNEEKNIPLFHTEIRKVLDPLPHSFEIIFINDGSRDRSGHVVEQLSTVFPEVRFIEFSRNFGKEIALTAGLQACRGDAALVIDADLQHPPQLIPEFIERWERGADVVVGVRKQSKSETAVKRVGSYWFYKMINLMSDTKIVPQSTDFRLIDRSVIDEFNRITERNRITRGLIDWLGFKRDYIYFDASERAHGQASYSTLKLVRLALTSFVSMSLFPLRIALYLGIFITMLSGLLAIVMVIDRLITPWNLNFSGPAILITIVLFLVGIILTSLGILAYYIGHIYQEVQNRPIYVIRRRSSDRYE